MILAYDPLTVARQFRFVRESGANAGQRVNAIQHWSGGADGLGQSWCCYFATMVLDICFQGQSPVPRLGACQDVYALAKKNNWLTEIPIPGDLVLSVDANDHAHHIGILVSVNPLTSIAGNTDDTGTSSNGDRVAEHAINPAGKVFIKYPR